MRAGTRPSTTPAAAAPRMRTPTPRRSTPPPPRWYPPTPRHPPARSRPRSPARSWPAGPSWPSQAASRARQATGWRSSTRTISWSTSTRRPPTATSCRPPRWVERWEEHPGYSPSTIAAEIAGLVAASRLAQAAGDPARAALYLATADDYQRHVKGWTVTSTGPYGNGRYFIRLSPTGDPNAAETYDLGNGSLAKVDQRAVIDAGFLELTRLGELPANDPDVQASLKIVDSVIETQTDSGPGWHRYGIKANGSTDGY